MPHFYLSVPNRRKPTKAPFDALAISSFWLEPICVIFFIFILLLTPVKGHSQTPEGNKLLQLKAQSDLENINRPAEKLYLQFDKPYYIISDTVWFKCYLFNGPTLGLSAKSGLIHIDVADENNKVIKKYLFSVNDGLAAGNITLTEADFLPGTYTIVAYTNWMRNFGDDHLFKKRIYVAAQTDHHLITVKSQLLKLPDGDRLKPTFQFRDLNNRLVMYRSMHAEVTTKGKRFNRQDLITDDNGMVSLEFKIPEKAKSPVITFDDETDHRKTVVPLVMNNPDNIDLQFLPEGGNLIAGLPAYIGFKGVGEDGNGVEVSGVIVDKANVTVATFKSMYRGMGRFDFLPAPNENYTAKLSLPGGQSLTYPFPKIDNAGTVLHVDNLRSKDSLNILVQFSDDLVHNGDTFFLIGKSREVICYAATLSPGHSKSSKITLAKALFPTGISHIQLTNTDGSILNERLLYINHNDELKFKWSVIEEAKSNKDFVTLQLNAADKAGNPVQGNFSLAVTDQQQVKQDSLNETNIANYVSLSSELKGHIEAPGYYFRDVSHNTLQRLDNLMLTQGWIRFDQNLKTDQAFIAETDLKVKGRVVNVFNMPVKSTRVQLFSKSPALVRDTLTDNKGYFTFTGLPLIDTPVFFLQAVNRNGKSFNVSINMDEPRPIALEAENSGVMPWYVNTDTVMLSYLNKTAILKDAQERSRLTGRVLQEVKITAKKIVKGSKNLNGPGNADFVFDEKDMEKAGKLSWVETLQQRVKGFRIGSVTFTTRDRNNPIYPSLTVNNYFINQKMVKFIVDGKELTQARQITSFIDLKNFLESQSAEDIKGIEISFARENTYNYRREFGGDDIKIQYTFVEITTRSGTGPNVDYTIGTYLYKPIAISKTNTFYTPNYNVTDSARKELDLRATVFWQPNITTDENGRATLTLYVGEKLKRYNLLLEGTDLNGNVGFSAVQLERTLNQTIIKP